MTEWNVCEINANIVDKVGLSCTVFSLSWTCLECALPYHVLFCCIPLSENVRRIKFYWSIWFFIHISEMAVKLWKWTVCDIETNRSLTSLRWQFMVNLQLWQHAVSESRLWHVQYELSSKESSVMKSKAFQNH